MIVTTAGRPDDETVTKSLLFASKLGVEFVPRRKQSVAKLLEKMEDSCCMVVGKERLELYLKGEEQPFFFHPNSAMFRIKRLLKGEKDPLVSAAELIPGMSVLDCTLGLGSDSIVASFVTGKTGSVIGIESNRFLAFLVYVGLKNWKSGLPEIDAAMRAVKVVYNNSLSVLKRMDTGSIDCVYFDPMFEETILESDGIRGLANFADYSSLTSEMVEEAYRVARKRVILKDHFRSARFEEFGFKATIRKSAKFHYGIMEKEDV
ncbi:class I SAM-dependent methyltransferase [Bacillus massilinigeriensis]|uniref:class I SAM-dependent methyltransferase n=1 Tax=Bacillus mediterraneensis TaxID=1805474 RepID=UPI0008F7EBD3|nr:class I SAM-dependent methyltransferase [Bacillus mediterraneensis]